MFEINIISSSQYDYLKQSIMDTNKNFQNIEIETKTFPDGEHYFRIKDIEKIIGKPVVYICGTINDAAIFEAYNISTTLVNAGCSSLHLVIPYFGYSTMERALKEGEVITSKNIARLFSSIPLATMGNYTYMIDLHSLEIQHYFEGNIHPVHLTTENIID